MKPIVEKGVVFTPCVSHLFVLKYIKIESNMCPLSKTVHHKDLVKT